MPWLSQDGQAGGAVPQLFRHPCQTCARECQIGAIRPTGEIIDNECHYCLDCQVTYWDEHRCPPLVRKRKKRFQGQLPEHAVIATDAAGSRRES